MKRIAYFELALLEFADLFVKSAIVITIIILLKYYMLKKMLKKY